MKELKEPKKEIYNDAWFFYKKWINNCDTDLQWQMIMKEANDIIKKHNDPFARSLIGVVITELEKQN